MRIEPTNLSEELQLPALGSVWFGLWEQLRASHQLLQSQLSEAAKQHGLRADEAAVVCLLGHGDKELATTASQRELARIVCVSPAKMSSLLEGLRERQLLTPARDRSDRRRQVWQLTTSGRQLCDAIVLTLNANSTPSAHFEKLAIALQRSCGAQSGIGAIAEPASMPDDHATGLDDRERAA